MKKIILLSVALMSILGVSSAQAGGYFGARGGWLDINAKSRGMSEYASDYAVAVFTGYHYSFLRAELEYGYNPIRYYQAKEMKSNVKSLLGWLYFEPPVLGKVRPFAALGAGASFQRMNISGQTDNNIDFSYGFQVGMSFEWSRKVFTDISFRMVDHGDADCGDDSVSIKSQGGFMSLRFEY